MKEKFKKLYICERMFFGEEDEPASFPPILGNRLISVVEDKDTIYFLPLNWKSFGIPYISTQFKKCGGGLMNTLIPDSALALEIEEFLKKEDQ